MRSSVKFEAREGSDTRPGESRAKETLTKFSIDKRMQPRDGEEQKSRGGGGGREWKRETERDCRRQCTRHTGPIVKRTCTDTHAVKYRVESSVS